MPGHEFEKYSTLLFDEWERFVGKLLMLPDYHLALEVEEGSVKGRGKIAVVLGALYLGIGNYGSFISGLQTISNQVSSVGNFLATRAAGPFESRGFKPKVRKHGDSLSGLQRLFVKVQRGEITVDQAMQESEALLGDEASTSPEFMQKLRESLKQAPRFPQQIALPLDTLEQDAFLPDSKKYNCLGRIALSQAHPHRSNSMLRCGASQKKGNGMSVSFNCRPTSPNNYSNLFSNLVSPNSALKRVAAKARRPLASH